MTVNGETKMLDFGEILRNKRLQEGMTLKTLAYELDKMRDKGDKGLTESYLSLLETGKRPITFPLLRVIIRRFPDLWGEAIAYTVSYLAAKDEGG